MRVIVQTVKNANVLIEDKISRNINKGLLVYVSFKNGDTEKIVEKMVYKVSGLRIFADSEGKINLSLKDIDGEMLIISNFTIYATLAKGFRPSFDEVLEHSQSEILYKLFVDKMKEIFLEKIKTGEFRAKMEVSSVNLGPKNFIYEIL